MHVCVFCASSSRIDPAHTACARELGAWIGARGHALVWGGCNVGLMDEIGRAARAAGARTVAIVPEFLVARGLAFASPTERIVTADLAARKHEFRRRADAYVALPGGVGTWEEILEVLALRKLGQLEAPIVLVNSGGYYDPLVELLERSIACGFSPPELRGYCEVAGDAATAIACLERAAAPRRGSGL